MAKALIPERATSAQTATTANPFASNTQDFSGSDDEILDNFAEGPDDGVPLGLGGERGKQAEPASVTLEADIVNGTIPAIPATSTPATPKTKQPDAALPSETASETEPIQGPASEKRTEESSELGSESELPPMLLRMAGYADAEAAKADGFDTPELLNAYVRGRGKLLASKPVDDDQIGQIVHPYVSRSEINPPVAPVRTPPPPEKTKPEAEAGEFKPFELTPEEVEILDERLVDTIRRMNEHNQRQFDTLRSSLSQREQKSAEDMAEEEAWEFDKAVQSLGSDWQDVFGEGNVMDLVQKGQTDPTARLAIEYRRDLFDAVQAVRAVNAQRGFEPMDLQREIGFGLMQKFPDRFQKSLSGNSSPRRNSLSRPTQRRAPAARQDQLLAKLSKKYPQGGFGAPTADELDGDI